MCLRESRLSRGRPALPVVGEGDIEVALIEGHVGQQISLTNSFLYFVVTCFVILFVLRLFPIYCSIRSIVIL